MQLGDIKIFGSDAGLFVHAIGRRARHIEADDTHHIVRIKRRREIGDHDLGRDPDIGSQAVLFCECLGRQNRCCRAAGRRTGHKTGHDPRPDNLVVHHLFCRYLPTEDGKRIVLGVPACFCANLCEGFQFSTVLFHVAQSGAAEITQRQGNLFRVNKAVGYFVKVFERARPIGEYRTERAGSHLLESKY